MCSNRPLVHGPLGTGYIVKAHGLMLTSSIYRNVLLLNVARFLHELAMHVQ